MSILLKRLYDQRAQSSWFGPPSSFCEPDTVIGDSDPAALVVDEAVQGDRAAIAPGEGVFHGVGHQLIHDQAGRHGDIDRYGPGVDLKIEMDTFHGLSRDDGRWARDGNDLDAVLSTADSVLTVVDKAPGQLKIVYLTDTSAGADAILAKKDIKTIKDMKGRKVAATLGQCNQLLLADGPLTR